MVLDQLFPDIQIYVRLVRFFIVFGIGVFLTRLLIMPLAEKLLAKRNADPVSIHSFSNLAGVTSVFMSFIIALQAAEFGNLVSVLGAITAALTLAIGFGMRDQVSNLVAGFLLYIDNPFIKGDYIQVGEKTGTVKEIKLRHTTIKNGSSEKTVLPNAMLTTNPVENYSKNRKTMAATQYKIKAEKAGKLEEIIQNVLENEEKVLETPEPKINYQEIEEDKTGLKAIFSASNPRDIGQIKNSVNKKVNEKAVKQGLFEEKQD